MQRTSVSKFKLPKSFAALRHTNYRWFWASAVGQSVAMGMQQLTVSWLILEITDSLSQFGIVSFFQGVPMLIFMLFGGALADKFDRLKLMIASTMATTLIVCLLAVLTVTDYIQIWHIYVSAAFLGAIQAVNTPTRTAVVGNLVPREDLMNAVALNNTLMNLARILGPSVTGFIIESLGIGPTLFMNTGFYIMGILFLLPIRGVKVAPRQRKTTVFKDVVDGVKYTKSNAPAWAIVLIGFSAGLFTFPIGQIVPAFAKEEMHLSASGAGLLQMVTGIGALVASLSVATLGNYKHKNWLFIASAFLCAIPLFLFAVIPWFPLSMFFLALVGFGTMIFLNLGITLLQLLVPPEYAGRALSLWFVGAAFIFLGVFPISAIGDITGLRWSLGGSALIGLFFAIWLGLLWPPLRNMRSGLEVQQKASAETS